MSFKLNKGEYIIFEAKRNWIVPFRKIVPLVASILVPIVIFSILSSFDSLKFVGDKDALFMIFLLTWVFIVWNFIFVAWTDFYLDILIITNERLIDIEQKGLFHRDIAIAGLDNVEDITTIITGFVPTVLGYGDLKIQSAGSETEFIMKDINNPVLVRGKIREAMTGNVSEEEIE